MDVSAMAPFTNVECPTCGKHTRVKREFGPYTLTKRHAIGGMSMVFSAHDNMLNREVALKILSETYSADEARIAAFEQEARLTASLSHPNIVRVFTTGRAFGYFYIAMEFVPGGHLEQRIKSMGQVPEDLALELAIQVAHGLSAAQHAGLIHRDVKPGNILLDSAGQAKLVDFGLALVTLEGKATASEIWATPYYVPPEAVEGKEEDFRSDIYAFGATFYHAMAGKPPCDEESMSTDLLRKAKRNIISLCKAERSISRLTCTLIDQTMSYQPEDRPASYEELISRLQNCLLKLRAKNTQNVTRAERKGQAAVPTKLPPRSAIVIGGALVTIIVAAIAGTALLRKKPAPATQARHSASEPAPLAQDPPSPDTPAAPIDIAQTFSDASTAFATAEYTKAASLFHSLFSHPSVQEPTRTWSGINSTLASYLCADTRQARATAHQTLDHLDTLTQEQAAPFSGTLSKVLSKLDTPEPITATALTTNGDLPDNTAILIAALKNWQQGHLDKAASHFKTLTALTATDDPTTTHYQRIAQDYLADHKLLTTPAFRQNPADTLAFERALDELNTSLAIVKTPGRARFNITARRRDLTLFASQHLATQKASTPPPVSIPDVLAKVEALDAQRDFASSETLLSTLPTDPPGAKTSSLRTIHRHAADFIETLSTDLQRAPQTLTFQLPSGEPAKTIVCQNGRPLVTLTNGTRRTCTWADIPPDAMIFLHRILIRNVNDDTTRLARHTQAIAFDWLVGNRNRATAAAATLSQTNTAFAISWDEIANGLPK